MRIVTKQFFAMPVPKKDCIRLFTYPRSLRVCFYKDSFALALFPPQKLRKPDWWDPLASCRNLIKRPWVFIRVLDMDPNILGSYDQGFLIRFLHYMGLLGPKGSAVGCDPHAICSGLPVEASAFRGLLVARLPFGLVLRHE